MGDVRLFCSKIRKTRLTGSAIGPEKPRSLRGRQFHLRCSSGNPGTEPYPGAVCILTGTRRSSLRRSRPTLDSHARDAHPTAPANARRACGRHKRRTTPRRGRRDAETRSAERGHRRAHEGPGDGACQVAYSDIREAGPSLSPHHAATRIPIHRHDMWWSTQTPRGRTAHALGLRSAAYPGSRIPTSERTPSTHSGE